MKMRTQAGFTLIELLVVIVCSSVITWAAMSFLLMGVRVSASSQDNVSRQQTSRIILTMLEDLASSGEISRIDYLDSSKGILSMDDIQGTEAAGEEPGESDKTYYGWCVFGKTSDDDGEQQILQYDSLTGTVETGNGTVLLSGVTKSSVELTDDGLLCFSITVDGETYSTGVYCRNQVYTKVNPSWTVGAADSQLEALTECEKNARYNFLCILATQYGSSGQIKGGASDGQYFSEWYIGGYDNHPGWNEDTPWCACFVSWAANTALQYGLLNDFETFSHVNNGMDYFQRLDETVDGGHWIARSDDDGKENENFSDHTPNPGDVIFFETYGEGKGVDHVGIVLYVNNGTIYTIEGNSGGHMVTVQSYSKSDDRIYGYGVLDWKTD